MLLERRKESRRKDFLCSPPTLHSSYRYTIFVLYCTRGGLLILVRAFPANAAAFVGYEWTIQLLDMLDKNTMLPHQPAL